MSYQLQPHNRTVAIAHALTRFFTCIDGYAHEHLGLAVHFWHVGDDGVERGATRGQLRPPGATPERHQSTPEHTSAKLVSRQR